MFSYRSERLERRQIRQRLKDIGGHLQRLERLERVQLRWQLAQFVARQVQRAQRRQLQ